MCVKILTSAICKRATILINSNNEIFLSVFLLFQLLTLVSSAPSSSSDFPVDAAALQLAPEDDPRSYDEDVYAFINVTYKDQYGWKWEKADVGRFGGGYIGPAYGVVVHISGDNTPEDHTGCYLPLRSTRSDRQLPPPGEPWIALIKRGRCNFEVKVENAYRSRASGVLVYNDRDSSMLDKMKLSTDTGRNISAVFTFKWKGEELAKLVENDSKVLVHITVARRDPSRSAAINRTSVLFVSVTFIVLMIISLAWLVFYYVQRFRYIHAKDRLSRRLCNAAKKALSKIPTKNIKSDDKEVQEGECCAICIEPYKISDVLRMLPCHHEFHKSCIDPWLLEHRTCPMCKMDILRHYGFMCVVTPTLLHLRMVEQFSGSQESILHMEIEEVVGLGSNDSQDSDSPRRGGVSPLPQIRTAVLTDPRRSFGSSVEVEDRSSRASTPDETTPSLPTRRPQPVRQDLCANCIAAAASQLVNTQDDNIVNNTQQFVSKSNYQSQNSNNTTSQHVQQVLSSNNDSNSLVQMTQHCAQVQSSDK